MPRLRMSITKDEPLRFLGHLDFLRTMERALRRAALPIAYSEGFNPHMKVSYDTALAVGMTADPYYMDIELTQDLPLARVAEQLVPQLPTGIRLTAAGVVPATAAKLMAWSDYESFRIIGERAGAVDGAAITAAWAAQTAIRYRKVTPKQVREIDVLALVPTPPRIEADEAYIRVEIGICKTAQTGIKPAEIWAILVRDYGLPAAADECLIHRTGTYRREADGRLVAPTEEWQ